MSTTSHQTRTRERRGLADRILAPLLLALARLPLPALYRISDLAFFISYRVLRARRRVARENLRRCFPDQSESELARIEERCYRNTCDAAVEWLRLLAAPIDEIRARVDVDLEFARQLYEHQRSMIFVLGHCGNWEWAIPAATGAYPNVTFHIVYHPLAIAALDRLSSAARVRAGALLSTMEEAPRAIVRMRRELSATVLVADQRPRSRNPYRTQFFGRETTFLRGPERLARRLDMPVVFVEMVRTERGRYRIHLEWLCEDPSTTVEGEITERFARRLEQQIRAAPDDWFWIHRRWRDRRAERAR
jgi:Kdo2-lipid IVA lauroyltransferase/acyltransferase